MKITNLKKIVLLVLIAFLAIGISNNVLAVQAQTETKLGVETYKNIQWVKFEGDQKEVQVGKYVRYNPGVQSDAGKIMYYKVTSGIENVSVTLNSAKSYVEVTGKKAGTAKINIYYTPCGENFVYQGIYNHSMKTLTVKVVGGSSNDTNNGNTQPKQKCTITFLNSNGQNIKKDDNPLVMSEQVNKTIVLPKSTKELKANGYNIGEDISNAEFIGWKNSNDGKTYASGTTYTVKANCSFTAQYKAKGTNSSESSSANSSTTEIYTSNLAVNDTLKFTATSWHLYSDKEATKVKAYLLTGDKVKILEINKNILKVEVVSAKKLKVGNTYYMKYAKTAQGNFEIGKAPTEQTVSLDSGFGIIRNILKFTIKCIQPFYQEQTTEDITQTTNNEDTLEGIINIGIKLLNSFLATK